MTLKVLVIEDEQLILDNILETLELEGFDATGAPNGLVGVQRARQLAPDLIMCDIMMPELDGYGVLRELRNDPSMTHIPFIFISAIADQDSMRHSLKMGASGYLAKPFTVMELLDVVHKFTPRHF
jgi:CheY-like chemotaxis protein